MADEAKKAGAGGGCLILGGLLLVMYCMSVADRDEPPSPQEQERQAQAELNAEVRFGGGAVTVTNRDSFEWRNVELQINPRLRGSWSTRVSRIAAGQSVAIAAGDFTGSGGERFNLLTHKPEDFAIHCDTPSGGRGHYFGTWAP